ncbi:DNA adenine methylase [Treponema sp.]|uniref:DNA adenine methylase n=1 Tax=Treponema sp. TaxID=166 RepID=UPI0025E74250|nr:DNA adenine methylase [Treponema sp.]MCR5217403.1 DNA adenine methylase [Treponema sp.]
MFESEEFLTRQLITYIGNKRSLLTFIDSGIQIVRKELGKDKLSVLDMFSGSGIVSRYLKKYASVQYANDLENYAASISRCYLSNAADVDMELLKKLHSDLIASCHRKIKNFLSEDENSFVKIPGFISEYYAPKNIEDIRQGERCFYTPYNACYLDVMRQLIEKKVPPELRDYFIAPLLSEASIHANTGGVFKGFYKNSATGIGKFGGTKADALSRIKGKIELPFPVFSSFKSKVKVMQSDANLAAENISQTLDLVYIDPPYNQHPYGSNYFMLNLLADYKKPDEEMMSRVSGIPKDWNRSAYNKKMKASDTFFDLVSKVKAKYLLVSFNNEGFISEEEMLELLGKVGKVTVLEEKYNAFRASRNLRKRAVHTKEYLYVVKKY